MSEYICGVYIGQYKVLLELYLRSVPKASDLVYMCSLSALWPASLMACMAVRACASMRECEHVVDGWMDAHIYSVASLSSKLSGGMGKAWWGVMLVPWVTS